MLTLKIKFYICILYFSITYVQIKYPFINHRKFRKQERKEFSQDNSRLFAHSFSPKFNLHVRNAWIITRLVINIGWTISTSEYFRNRTNPIFAYSRLVVICTPAALIETRYIPNYSHCAGFALSHYRFNVRIPFICRAKLFNQPS